jgi:hypothetical protein
LIVVCSFIFTLQEFARELGSLVDAMERIYRLEQERVNRRAWWTRISRGFGERMGYLRAWWGSKKMGGGTTKKQPGLKRRLCTSYNQICSSRTNFRLAAFIIPEHRQTHPSFPKVRPHAPNTIQTPPWSNLTLIGKAKQSVWTIWKRLTERDTKYAVKAGMAMAILAAPAFFESTRPIFIKYWGDWALISVSCGFTS